MVRIICKGAPENVFQRTSEIIEDEGKLKFTTSIKARLEQMLETDYYS